MAKPPSSLRGGRSVGKSTLVDEFGLNEHRSHLVIDFFQAPNEVPPPTRPSGLRSAWSTALKCYLADTGLFVALAFADKRETDENVYRSVLRGDTGINEGMLTENVVAQMLRASGRKLFFYSQSGKKEGEARMETDFLIARPCSDAATEPRACPVEVKSPRRYGTASLDRFKEKFGKRIGSQYVLHPKQLKVDGDRVYLPLYMGFCL